VNQFPVAIATREAQWDFNSWPYLSKTWEAKGHLQFSVNASIFSLSVAETSLFSSGASLVKHGQRAGATSLSEQSSGGSSLVSNVSNRRSDCCAKDSQGLGNHPEQLSYGYDGLVQKV